VRFAPQLLEQLPQWNWPAAGVGGGAGVIACSPVSTGARRFAGGGDRHRAGQWLNLSAYGVKMIGSST
jgi:hypothetical protein